jgi:peptidyl-prolyl cis-trans isomerase B (cyclophilin B)
MAEEKKIYHVTITMQDGGVMKGELYPDIAPITVANFKKLADEHFYDGLIFHRVIPGFMIQGGDPQGTGYGGSDENIKGEFLMNGVPNPISHERGVISMARSQDPNSASSQFFIMHEDGTFLDGQYAAFGRVVEGMDVVDEIASVRTNAMDKPLETQRMQSVRIVD